MTSHEFQEKYHDYRTPDKAIAVREAMKIRLSDGSKVVAVKLGDECCLMLSSAAEELAKIGIGQILGIQDILGIAAMA